ncbi:FHA domain-containing protein [Moraxella sp. PS-22]|uniref:FHA domain-containing protein n=1 Tax=Moraxella tetraodonis TaxID=2767221 RepID=A0A9X2A0U6_9GAMM|nr:FHA domain-containing protein [Moraxella tetraodonis]MCG8147016.1 FHA domain-containing protein [Moraxella tetraodonis]
MDNHQTNAVNTMNLTDNSQSTLWQLIGLSPALVDLTIDIDKSLSIGRSDSNDLVLATSQISRQHAKINRIGEQLYVQDLGSSNGTFINGERISTDAHALQATDELAFADLVFLVVNAPVDALDGASFLDSLQDIENFTPTTDIHTQTESTASVEHISPNAAANAAPVIDVVTTQDFLPSEQMSNTHVQQSVPSTPTTTVDVASVDNSPSPIVNTPSQPPVVTETVAVPLQPVVPSVQVSAVQPAQPSPVSTVDTDAMKPTPMKSEPTKPAAKKNATVAIMIVVIIALIIASVLLMY